jgi:hypothetical protein
MSEAAQCLSPWNLIPGSSSPGPLRSSWNSRAMYAGSSARLDPPAHPGRQGRSRTRPRRQCGRVVLPQQRSQCVHLLQPRPDIV